MEFRQIGRTGMSASVVGLGAEHLQGKSYAVVEEVVHAALDHGMNVMDLFMPEEEVRRNIGKALAGRRDRMMIQGHIGSVTRNGQNDISRDLGVCKAKFEELLRCLGTDYIDLGMLFFIDSQADFDGAFTGEILEYALQLKAEGKIRALGASSHNPVMARKVVETGLVDMIMFSVNPAFDMAPASSYVLDTLEGKFKTEEYAGIDPQRAGLYKLCESAGVGITVMKCLGAGKLISKEHSPFKEPMTVAQCIHYALSRPAVASVLVGCVNAAQVAAAAAYPELPAEAKDYSRAFEGYGKGLSGQCVYCDHCLPCPAGIDVAAVHRYLDIALLDSANVPPSVAQHYRALPAKGGDCLSCGSCESRCPFSVPVARDMAKAAEVFGS
jgi:Predicted oxidoreductases of the aldo/keto reductase family